MPPSKVHLLARVFLARVCEGDTVLHGNFIVNEGKSDRAIRDSLNTRGKPPCTVRGRRAPDLTAIHTFCFDDIAGEEVLQFIAKGNRGEYHFVRAHCRNWLKDSAPSGGFPRKRAAAGPQSLSRRLRSR